MNRNGEMYSSASSAFIFRVSTSSRKGCVCVVEPHRELLFSHLCPACEGLPPELES